ncbi:MAG TPA: MFS transporter [Xanthomonadales bacterium]|nr:MFS transporter [Xanthomonadales bacterium]
MIQSATDTALPATRVRWRILAILMFVSFVSYLLRGNLSIAGPAMIEDLQLTEIQWGWIMAAFPLGYALFQFPGGCWGDRKGPRFTMAAITIAWGVLIAVTSLTPARDVAPVYLVIGFLLTVQFLVGVSHAPVFPIMVAAIQRWFPPGGWALPNGLTSAGLTVGLAVTASALPWLIGEFGWRIGFLVLAPFAFAAGGLWWWYSRDYPQQHRAVNAAEVALINAEGPLPESGAVCESAWRRVLKNRDALFVTFSYASMNFVFYVVFSWGYYYMVTVRGMGAQEAGFLTSAQWVAGAAGAFIGGWAGDYLCKRLGVRWGCRWPIVIGCSVSALLLLGVALHPNAYVAAGMLGACFFFNQFTEGAFAANGAAIGGRHAGSVYGLFNTGANMMGFINAILLSAVAAKWGWKVAIALGSVFALLSVLFILFSRADQQMDQAD